MNCQKRFEKAFLRWFAHLGTLLAPNDLMPYSKCQSDRAGH
jgi:hypothetical protein